LPLTIHRDASLQTLIKIADGIDLLSGVRHNKGPMNELKIVFAGLPGRMEWINKLLKFEHML
jgi:hypothetical protein